ncbi:hypothetical protein G5V58_07615 [Nocardioides anomalus]|uniref:Uncharacterized protein n=1 Tax=Nocardioides anomalus TaxID=2712223 RepID=A0A6G6WBR2_9ACTN|nr:hypothetical protein [Nocardioides anomalus]QIG42664.1 hypothetical protein G5V58_07615 [Nocardioides anomalus]
MSTADEIEAAVTRVLTDFGSVAQVASAADRLRGGPGVPLSRAALVVWVADQLQNDGNLWLRGAWGRPLPPCPGHQHPANARAFDDEAWWVCPEVGEPVGRIGELAG